MRHYTRGAPLHGKDGCHLSHVVACYPARQCLSVHDYIERSTDDEIHLLIFPALMDDRCSLRNLHKLPHRGDALCQRLIPCDEFLLFERVDDTLHSIHTTIKSRFG